MAESQGQSQAQKQENSDKDPVQSIPADAEKDKPKAANEVKVEGESETEGEDKTLNEEFVVMHALGRFQRGNPFEEGDVVTKRQIVEGAFDNELSEAAFTRLRRLGALKPIDDPEAQAVRASRLRTEAQIRRDRGG